MNTSLSIPAPFRPLHSANSSPRAYSPHISHLFTYIKVHRGHTRTSSATSRRPSPPLQSLPLYVKGRPASGGGTRRGWADKAVRKDAGIVGKGKQWRGGDL